MKIRREHFIPNLPHDAARSLFKASVEIVPISISRYCNRICPYCPNSVIDRMVPGAIDDALFASIVGQLAEIEYNGIVALNRYNEPLADFDYALGRVRQVRAALPHAKIEISTNGDFLDRDGVFELRRAGLTDLVATCHAQPGVNDFQHLIGLFDQRLAKLDLLMVSEERAHDHANVVLYAGEGLHFLYRCYDANSRDAMGRLASINDRGGWIKGSAYSRSAPCDRQFKAFEIEWDGTLWPCCQIHNDLPEHMNYCLGKLTAGSDIFTAWTSEPYVAWRKELFAYGQKRRPCAHCNYLVNDTALDHSQVADLRAELIA